MNITRVARRGGLATAALVATAVFVSACSPGTDASDPGNGKGTINVWSHQGTPEEVKAIQDAVNGFNTSQADIKVDLRLIPGDS
jgi:multiple sugar transport system substrate-binding protein